MDIGNLVYTFFNTAGPGGALAMGILTFACVVYFLLTRWIVSGGGKPD
jgi:hypothetical protein